LLDDYPLSVRIEVDRVRDAARLLLAIPEVLAVDVRGEPPGLVVQARNPKRFFEAFGKLVVEEELEVRRMEPLDESAHAILGYLLGGSGRT
jgi:ABC-2 type transport system ATP-binding protein